MALELTDHEVDRGRAHLFVVLPDAGVGGVGLVVDVQIGETAGRRHLLAGGGQPLAHDGACAPVGYDDIGTLGAKPRPKGRLVEIGHEQWRYPAVYGPMALIG